MNPGVVLSPTALQRPGGGAQSPGKSADRVLADMFLSELLSAGAAQRSADVFLELRGLAGGEPKSLRRMNRGLTAERIRQLVRDVERGPLRAVIAGASSADSKLAQLLRRLLVAIEQAAPGSDATISTALARADLRVASPASVIRMADTLGCHHGLRLTAWSSRAKFKDEDLTDLAGYNDAPRRVTVTGIVPAEMPEVFDAFINFARKFSRGAGIIGAGVLADRYSRERGVPLTGAEAQAFLEPFAVHLGRHDGDEWFAFFNSANDFLRKAANRVDLFGQCSFETLCTFHQRYNRSLYAREETTIPVAALRALLELAGYEIKGDAVSATSACAASSGRGVSEVQTRMVAIFRETLKRTGGRASVPRATLLAAMTTAGIRESTAHVYLTNLGIFRCAKGRCRLADALDDDDRGGAAPSGLPLSGSAFLYPTA